jgi:hypothetical protein
MTYVLSPLLYALYKMTSNMVHVLLVEVLNLISLGATTFLRVKDSLKMQLLIENPSLITSPKLQNLAFWVSQVPLPCCV